MNINFYRYPNSADESEAWQDCQFTADTDLTGLNFRTLVSINGQPILRQHHSAYLTGKETCRAHHFAKMLATRVLGDDSDDVNNDRCRVLWIDTLHGPHVCTRIYNELKAHAALKHHLHFVCLDVLGDMRGNVFAVTRNIEALIAHLKPMLVVIDDIDHLMPFCGVNIANEFCRVVRDVNNHTDTAFLFIGYNHLGKKASTTGNLGKYLFLDATDVFSLSTQREVTTVRLVRSYDLSRNPDDTEFHFTIGPDNLPHEVATNSNDKLAFDPADTPTVSHADTPPVSISNEPAIETDNHLTIKEKCNTINNSLTVPTLPQSHHQTLQHHKNLTRPEVR